MRTAFQLGLSAALLVNIVIWLVGALRVADAESDEGRSWSRRVRPVMLVTNVVGMVCIVGWLVSG